MEAAEVVLEIEPRFMSAGLIVHVEPPKDMVTVTSVVQARNR